MVYIKRDDLPSAGTCLTAKQPADPLRTSDTHFLSPAPISPLPLDGRRPAGQIIDRTAGGSGPLGKAPDRTRPAPFARSLLKNFEIGF